MYLIANPDNTALMGVICPDIAKKLNIQKKSRANCIFGLNLEIQETNSGFSCYFLDYFAILPLSALEIALFFKQRQIICSTTNSNLPA